MAALKIKKEHQKIIKDAVDNVLEKYPNIADEYEKGNFVRSDKVKCLQTRFSFDLLYGAGIQSWLCENVYMYANDSHMLSFLKTICPKVERKY